MNFFIGVLYFLGAVTVLTIAYFILEVILELFIALLRRLWKSLKS